MVHDHSQHIVAAPPNGPHPSIIDSGYHGCVVKALHVIDGRLVAIKMSKHRFLDHKEEYIREVRNLALLPRDHPNLIRYYSCHYDEDGTSGGLRERDRLYTVHEFVDGMSAKRIIQRELFKPMGGGEWELPTKTFLSWAQGLYNGLQAMHAMGMLHRDLHYGNVMITRPPLGERDAPETLSVEASAVKIVDVGMAKVVLNPEEHHSMSVYRGGMARYFSRRRRLGGSGDLSTHDDNWAAACILLELTRGEELHKLGDFGSEGCDFSTVQCSAQREELLQSLGSTPERTPERKLLQTVLANTNEDKYNTNGEKCKQAREIKEVIKELLKELSNESSALEADREAASPAGPAAGGGAAARHAACECWTNLVDSVQTLMRMEGTGVKRPLLRKPPKRAMVALAEGFEMSDLRQRRAPSRSSRVTSRTRTEVSYFGGFGSRRRRRRRRRSDAMAALGRGAAAAAVGTVNRGE